MWVSIIDINRLIFIEYIDYIDWFPMIDFYRLETPEELLVPYPVRNVETVSSIINNVLGTLKINGLKIFFINYLLTVPTTPAKTDLKAQFSIALSTISSCGVLITFGSPTEGTNGGLRFLTSCTAGMIELSGISSLGNEKFWYSSAFGGSAMLDVGVLKWHRSGRSRPLRTNSNTEVWIHWRVFCNTTRALARWRTKHFSKNTCKCRWLHGHMRLLV